MSEKKRLYYADYCKLVLIVLVMVYHASHAYSGADWPMTDTYFNSMSIAYAFIRAFAMGLYFMLSGVFVVSSVEKRSLGSLFVNKFGRLIFPVIIIAMVLTPLNSFIIAKNSGYSLGFFKFYIDEYIKVLGINYGHGWFLMLLFVFIMVYAIWTKVVAKKFLSEKSIELSMKILLIMAVISGLLSVWIRQYYQVNEWVNIGILGIEPAHIFTYIIMFILGIWAGKNGWLNKIPPRIGRYSLAISLLLGIVYVFSQIMNNFGWEAVAIYWRFLESFFSIFFSFGLLYIFSVYYNKENRFVMKLVDIYYVAFIVHVSVTISLQVLFSRTSLTAGMKCLCVCVLTVLGSFLVAYIYSLIKPKRRAK